MLRTSLAPAIEEEDAEDNSSVEDDNVMIEDKSIVSASNIQGTGLGLNIVASYVELMNGKVEVFSEENVGTTFKLTFTN